MVASCETQDVYGGITAWSTPSGRSVMTATEPEPTRQQILSALDGALISLEEWAGSNADRYKYVAEEITTLKWLKTQY